jgi:pyruvate/2-oxoglutarate dehydrogenase complex dihydrolipoamide dehydrogenase (E3) component
MYAQLVVSRLKERRVQVFTGVMETEITRKGAKIIDRDGKRISLQADNIIIATGFVPDKSMFESLKGKVPELYEVGDCVQVRRIHEAIYEGATVGLKI